ncbi:MAG: hypothetical protein CBC13_12175 [Planctomycetia bacterium TMED53]|nr:MAG: hypothetical protein CBC13_12175 [Planctomycetia bacterium TMED53]
MDQFSAVILAAGRGTRMRSSLPKVLHPLLGVPMLDHVFQHLREAGASDVIVVVGHGSDQIREHLRDADVRVAIQDPQRGTGHALLEALDQCPPRNQTVVVVNGDLPDLDSALVKRLVEQQVSNSAALTVTCGKVDHPQGMGRIIRSADAQISKITEEADLQASEREIQEVNLGLYALDHRQVLPVLRPMVEEDLSTDDSSKEAYLTRLVECLGIAGLHCQGWDCGISSEFAQVNDRRQLAEVSRLLQTRWQNHWMDQGVTIVDPSSTWIEMGVEIGQDTTIEPHTVIRRGVVIGQRCEIGPFAHIRSGTTLEDDVIVGDFVEVNRSRMATGSKAKHLAYLGDVSVGEKANIGAGAVIANYDGTHKHGTEIGNKAFIGSGSVIVAPGSIGSEAVVAAGALVPPGRVVEPGTTVMGVPAKVREDDRNKSDQICEDEKGT